MKTSKITLTESDLITVTNISRGFFGRSSLLDLSVYLYTQEPALDVVWTV